ncbi:hypothetical protein CF336_g6662 [Tilletia laevis]|nr:hypothetical protein CF336_g6662 [Tilletia laevis]
MSQHTALVSHSTQQQQQQHGYGATSHSDHHQPQPQPQPPVIYSKNNVLDLRAAQRTFDGAYARTALGQLSFSVVVLRLFQSEFILVGIAYVALAIGLFVLSIWRYKLTMQSPVETVDDQYALQQRHQDRHPPQRLQPSAAATTTPTVAQDPPSQRTRHRHAGSVDTSTRPPKLNTMFRTAGDVVAVATAFTLALQIALLVLVFRL